jgi:ABC-2 type transport system ATP-binding protein
MARRRRAGFAVTIPATEPRVPVASRIDHAVVRVEGLTKRFPARRGLRQTLLHPFDTTKVTVVSNVSFSAEAGEFLGLLGPNGAGKTTLLKMLSTLILPDEGSATIDGNDVVHDAAIVRALVSPCLAMERSLYYRLTARENLEVYADLQAVPRTERAGRIDEVLAAVSLDGTGEKLVGQYSSGMLQRLLIARALLTRPRLLLLDEPTRSLDPISAREFRAFMRDELARQRGCAVILATHNAEEAFELCDRVAILDRGRMLASGVAAQLSRDFMGVRYRLTTTDPDHPALRDLAGHGISVLNEAGGEKPEARDQRPEARDQRPEARSTTVLPFSPDRSEWYDVLLLMEPRHDPSDVLAALASRGMRIAAFEPVRPSLAELIEGVVRRGSVE